MQFKYQLKKYFVTILVFINLLPLAALATAEREPMMNVETAHTPNRIISLGPVLTEEIYLLEAESGLVGNTTYCVNPQAAQNIPKVGTVVDIDLEKLLSVKPDLVLATSLTNQQQLEKLKQLGLHIEVFSYARNYQEICESFLRLARLIGREERARILVDKSREEAEAIKQEICSLKKTRVFVQVGANPLFTSPKDTFIHSYIEMAGGENIAEDAVTGLYSREKVLERNPDVILIVTMGLVSMQEMEAWKKYPSINAVKNNKIFILDPYEICSPTPLTFIEALKKLIPMLHPGLNGEFPPENIAQTADENKTGITSISHE